MISMTRHYKMSLQKIGLKNIRACGVELRGDHVLEWKRKLDADDLIIQGDVASPKLDINKALGLAEEERPLALFWGHGGYYLYQLKEGVERGSDAELSEQPALAGAISLIHRTLSTNGISISVHKATEWMDIAKRRFARLVESDTTEALRRIYARQGLRHCPVTFECELILPELTPDLRRRLLSERLEEYAQMEPGQAKTVRQILEFLVHTPLEELGRAERDEAPSLFAERNLQKRRQYVGYIEELMRRHNGTIPTYVNFVVSVSPQATPQFAEAVIRSAGEVNDEVGKKIDMRWFLRTRHEIERLIETSP
jgi:hypothetical protein